MPTHEQIKAAARVNGWRIDSIPYDDDSFFVDANGAYAHSPAAWRPWADTEAGRSDALVLLAAVEKYAAAQEHFENGYGSLWYDPVHTAMESGNVQQIQAATFAAAVAIGKFLTGEEGK